MAKLRARLVLRDLIQAIFNHRISLKHPKVRRIIELAAQLADMTRGNPDFEIDAFEIGGAHPQVTAEHFNEDYMEIYRMIREIAPRLKLRPLWRGANGFLLVPSHEKDLRHLLTQMAQDLATSELSREEEPQLLVVKIFDSQGLASEVASSVKIISELYAQGYRITPEIGIPYSGGDYPVQFYVQKVLEAARLLSDSKIPLHLCCISLKDMAGELSETEVEKLLPEIIKALKKEKLEIPLGLHLHNTGLATKAYAKAKEICARKEKPEDKEYPLVVDGIDCDQVDSRFSGENSWKNAGFSGILEINDEVKAAQGKGFLNDECESVLSEIKTLVTEVTKSHKVRRADPKLKGKELRKFHIPGGAFASFSDAVAAMDLAKQLRISDREALLLAGHALNAVGRLMGEPFGVTPGFQNKQIAALNFIKNKIEAGELLPGKSISELINKVLEVIDDNDSDKMERLFFKGLDSVVNREVLEFLKGEMPAETMQRMERELRIPMPTSARLHPYIRKKIPLRTQPLTETTKPKLPPEGDLPVILELLREGRIKATKTQARKLLKELKLHDHVDELLDLLEKQKIIYNGPDGSCEPWTNRAGNVIYQYFIDKKYDEMGAAEKSYQVVEELVKKTIQTNTTWALELRKPENIRRAVEQYWLREPSPEHPHYHHLLRKYKAGRKIELDHLEQAFKTMQSGKLPLAIVSKYAELAKQLEAAEIKVWLLDQYQLLKNATEKYSLEKMVEILYAKQRKLISDKSLTGDKFVFPTFRRLDLMLEYFKELIPEKNHSLVDAKRQAIENQVILSYISGSLTLVNMDPTAQTINVKKGQLIAHVEAMKTLFPIFAPVDGVIKNLKTTAVVAEGETIANYIIDESKEVITHNVPMMSVELAQKKKQEAENEVYRNKTLMGATKNEMLKQEAANAKPANEPTYNIMTTLKNTGYFGPQIMVNPWSINSLSETHIIINRGNCAAKLYADLKQAGCNVKIVTTKGDMTTPVIANAHPSEVVMVESYSNHDDLLETIDEIAGNHDGSHPYHGQKYWVHPGYGFVSEDAKFAKSFEALSSQRYNNQLVFVGPASGPMDKIGNKLLFRHLANEPDVAPEFNPIYFGTDVLTLNQAQTLLARRKEFDRIKEIGGDVMIKACAGGGGKGIKHFRIEPNLFTDPIKNDEANFKEYLRMLNENIDYAQSYYGNTQMVIEQFISADTRHLEIQLGITKAGFKNLGSRDCTPQLGAQKLAEFNLVQGDYDPKTQAKINAAADKVAEKMRKLGYEGLATLEMMIWKDASGEDQITFLEVNTRLQVEHWVTEDDIFIKTGRRISLPLLNFLFKKFSDETPDQILIRAFGLTQQQVQTMAEPGTERVLHIRSNSKRIDEKGNVLPSYYYDDELPSIEEFDNIAKETGARIGVGGLGDGSNDAQIGTFCGKEQATLAAAQRMVDCVETAQACFGTDGTLSLQFSTELYKLMLNDDPKIKGNFNPRFSTKTANEFLKALQNKHITLEVDRKHASISPKLKEGAMKKAFNEFLAYQDKLKLELDVKTPSMHMAKI